MQDPKEPRNVCGPQVRRIRYALGLSQPDLVAKCQLAGWHITRDVIAKIEDQRRWVGDLELMHLAEVLKVPVEQLLPKRKRRG